MLNRQHIIKILDDAISDAFIVLGFEKLLESEQLLLTKTADKIHAEFIKQLDKQQGQA